MSEEEEARLDADQLLTELRRSYTPTQADAERVFAATQKAVLLAAPQPAGVRGLKLWVGAACIAVVSGVLGYVLGYRSAQLKAAELAVVTPPTAAVEKLPPSAAETAQPAAGLLDPPLTPVRAGAAAPQPSAAMHRAPLPAAADPAARNKRSPQPSAPPANPESLEAELRLLRSVEQALRDEKPRQALAILDQLEREIPDGKLTEERLAAFAVARCAIGLGTRSTLLEQFVREHPNSVYRGRVEQACQP